jgi:hypothetical protein
MSETKHAPGPWIFCGNHVDDAMGVTLVRSTRRFDDLNCYDIRLIAAAPDLLAACRAMRDRLTCIFNEDDSCWNDWPESYTVDAAIAKAEGSEA